MAERNVQIELLNCMRCRHQIRAASGHAVLLSLFLLLHFLPSVDAVDGTMRQCNKLNYDSLASFRDDGDAGRYAHFVFTHKLSKAFTRNGFVYDVLCATGTFVLVQSATSSANLLIFFSVLHSRTVRWNANILIITLWLLWTARGLRAHIEFQSAHFRFLRDGKEKTTNSASLWRQHCQSNAATLTHHNNIIIICIVAILLVQRERVSE